MFLAAVVTAQGRGVRSKKTVAAGDSFVHADLGCSLKH